MNNNNVALVLVCRFCEKELINGPDIDEQSIIKIDFQQESISYLCPYCYKMNSMNLKNNSLGRELARPKGFK